MTFEKSLAILKKALSNNEIRWKEYGAVTYILEKAKICDICNGYGYIKNQSNKNCDCVDCKGVGFVFN